MKGGHISVFAQVAVAWQFIAACFGAALFQAGQPPTGHGSSEDEDQQQLRYPVKTILNQWRIIDHKGKLASVREFDEVGCFRDGAGVVRVGERWHVVDNDGQALFSMPPSVYPIPECPDEGIFRVHSNAHQHEKRPFAGKGYFDARTRTLHLLQYEYLMPFSEGLAAVGRDKLWGFISRDGTEAIPPSFESVGRFQEGYASAKLGGRFGFIDRKGQWVLDPTFRTANAVREGLAPVESFEGAWGFVNPVDGSFTPVDGAVQLQSLASQLAVVVGYDGQCGYVDRSGSIRITIKYSKCLDFQDSVARVAQGKKWGLVDRKGDWILHPTFDFIDEFNGPLAGVMNWAVSDPASGPIIVGSHQNTVNGYVDRTGKLVWWAGRPMDPKPEN